MLSSKPNRCRLSICTTSGTNVLSNHCSIHSIHHRRCIVVRVIWRVHKPHRLISAQQPCRKRGLVHSTSAMLLCFSKTQSCRMQIPGTRNHRIPPSQKSAPRRFLFIPPARASFNQLVETAAFTFPRYRSPELDISASPGVKLFALI
jgi:hypothetical protein